MPLTLEQIEASAKIANAFKQAEQQAALGERASLRYKIQHEINDIRDCVLLIVNEPARTTEWTAVLRKRLERIEHYLK